MSPKKVNNRVRGVAWEAAGDAGSPCEPAGTRDYKVPTQILRLAGVAFEALGIADESRGSKTLMQELSRPGHGTKKKPGGRIRSSVFMVETACRRASFCDARERRELLPKPPVNDEGRG